MEICVAIHDNNTNIDIGDHNFINSRPKLDNEVIIMYGVWLGIPYFT